MKLATVPLEGGSAKDRSIWAWKGAAASPGPRLWLDWPLLRLRRGRGGVGRKAAELGHQFDVSVEIGKNDDLADLGILVTGSACCRKAAPPARAATGAPANVFLAGIALGQRHVFGRAGIDQVESHGGFALLDVDAAGERADCTAPPAEVT